MARARRATGRWSPVFQFASQRTIVGIAVVVFLVGAPYFAWRRWGHYFVRPGDYRLTVDRIETTKKPNWIQADVVSEVVQQAQLEELTALDPKVTVKVGQAFALHPWVAKINFVTKAAGPKIIVDLTYRQPIAMVSAPNGFWPVDLDAVLLPTNEFSPVQVMQFLHIDVPGARPAGSAGVPFGDRRVGDCVNIARLFATTWHQVGFSRIVALPAQTTRSEPQYALVTKERSRVIWGRAPGKETSSERTADEKVAALMNFVKQQGPLHKQQLRVDLDLRFSNKKTAGKPRRRR